jgi:hypothetical protein
MESRVLGDCREFRAGHIILDIRPPAISSQVFTSGSRRVPIHMEGGTANCHHCGPLR